MRIKELKKLFTNGEIDVKSYVKQMSENYEELFSYEELIENSKVKEVIIKEKEVLFKMLMNSPICDEKGYEIIMGVYKKDYSAVPNIVLTLGDYEPLEFDMISRIANYMKGGAFFDIGANLGWYTINMKKQYPQMKVCTFEPIPETFTKMKKNIELNHIEEIEIFNIGLYNKNETLKFFYDVIDSGASSLQNLRENKETREVLCRVERMDDFVNRQGISTIDFIKCDVEGAELFVYEGGINSIKKFRPVIFSEMLRKWSAKFGYHPNDIIDLLASVGYQCFVIKEKGRLKKFDRVDEETVETNYLFLCPQKHAKIISDLCIDNE